MPISIFKWLKYTKTFNGILSFCNVKFQKRQRRELINKDNWDRNLDNDSLYIIIRIVVVHVQTVVLYWSQKQWRHKMVLNSSKQ